MRPVRVQVERPWQRHVMNYAHSHEHEAHGSQQCAGAFVKAQKLGSLRQHAQGLTTRQGAGPTGQNGIGAGGWAPQSKEGAATGRSAGLPGRRLSGAARARVALQRPLGRERRAAQMHADRTRDCKREIASRG